MVANENEKTQTMIKKFEDDLKGFIGDLKKREFYFYKTGVQESKIKIDCIQEEIQVFDQKIVDLGYNASKFGSPDLIQNAIKQVEGIKIEISNMEQLWA